MDPFQRMQAALAAANASNARNAQQQAFPHTGPTNMVATGNPNEGQHPNAPSLYASIPPHMNAPSVSAGFGIQPGFSRSSGHPHAPETSNWPGHNMGPSAAGAHPSGRSQPNDPQQVSGHPGHVPNPETNRIGRSAGFSSAPTVGGGLPASSAPQFGHSNPPTFGGCIGLSGMPNPGNWAEARSAQHSGPDGAAGQGQNAPINRMPSTIPNGSSVSAANSTFQSARAALGAGLPTGHPAMQPGPSLPPSSAYLHGNRPITNTNPSWAPGQPLFPNVPSAPMNSAGPGYRMGGAPAGFMNGFGGYTGGIPGAPHPLVPGRGRASVPTRGRGGGRGRGEVGRGRGAGPGVSGGRGVGGVQQMGFRLGGAGASSISAMVRDAGEDERRSPITVGGAGRGTEVDAMQLDDHRGGKEKAQSVVRTTDINELCPVDDMLFLMMHALKAANCDKAAEALEEELNSKGLLGYTFNAQGEKRNLRFSEKSALLPHVTSSHLRRLLALTVSKDEENTAGTGRCAQNGVLTRLKKVSVVAAQKIGASIFSSQPSSALPGVLSCVHSGRHPRPRITNQVYLNAAQEMGLRMMRAASWKPHIYHRLSLQSSVMGHFCAVYCLTFDRTGLRFITGSDDKLIKIWVSRTCQLYRTLRGHISDVVDLSVSCDNRFLASAGNDKSIRLWWLHNGHPQLVLPGHNDIISRVLFTSSLNDDLSHNLLSLSLDGTTRVWRISMTGQFQSAQIYSTDDTGAPYPPQGYQGQNKLPEVSCVAVAPDGSWVATGCSDKIVRMYLLDKQTKRAIRYVGHMDNVTHIQVSHDGEVLATGSTDGTARLWYISQSITMPRQKILSMKRGEDESETEQKKGSQKAAPVPEVKMLVFNANSRKLITSQAFEKKQRTKGGEQTWQSRLKVWDRGTGDLLFVFKDHDQTVFVVEPHPTDPRVFASAGYDACVIFWDIDLGRSVRKFHCKFEEDLRLNPPDFDGRSAEILDGKWGPDGTMFVVTHQNGYSSVISSDNRREKFATTLKEQFFETDFGELISDAHLNVIDRQAQVPPHTMPPGRLCDRFGAPHVLEEGMFVNITHDSQPQLVSPRVNRRRAPDVEVEDQDDEDDDDFVGGPSRSVNESESSDSGSSGSESEDIDPEELSAAQLKRREARRQRRQQAQRAERAEARKSRPRRERKHRETSHESDELSDSDLMVPMRASLASRAASSRSTQSRDDLKANAARDRTWLLTTEPPHSVDHGFVPQVGDELLYFHQGHMEQLSEYPEAHSTLRLPWEEYKDMKPAERCTVVSIKYQMPSPTEDEDSSVFCIIHLQRAADHQNPPVEGRKYTVGDRVKAKWKGRYKFPGKVVNVNDDGTYKIKFDDGDEEESEQEDDMEWQTFFVSYRNSHMAEFVIPIYRYERNIDREPFGPGDSFQMSFEGAERPYTGVVRAVNAVDTKIPESEWKCLMVVWDEERDEEVAEEYEELKRLSPWEITPVGATEPPPGLTSKLEEEERARIAAGIEQLMGEDCAEGFRTADELKAHAEFLSWVPVPLHLLLVKERLEKMFYRSRQAVQHDLELITKNARVYWKPGAEEIERSDRLAVRICELLGTKPPVAVATAASAPAAAEKGDTEGEAERKGEAGEAKPKEAEAGSAGKMSLKAVVSHPKKSDTWRERALRAINLLKGNKAVVVSSLQMPNHNTKSQVSVRGVRQLVGSYGYCLLSLDGMARGLRERKYASCERVVYDVVLLCSDSLLLQDKQSKMYKALLRMLSEALSLVADLLEFSKKARELRAAKGESESVHHSENEEDDKPASSAAAPSSSMDLADGSDHLNGGTEAMATDKSPVNGDCPAGDGATRAGWSGPLVAGLVGADAMGLGSIPEVGEAPVVPAGSEGIYMSEDGAEGKAGSSSGQNGSKMTPVAGLLSTDPQNVKDTLRKVVERLIELDVGGLFQEPVTKEVAPDYHLWVPTPMDLGTMSAKVRDGDYASVEQLGVDFLLVCANAIMYNDAGTKFHKAALDLLVKGQQVLQGVLSNVVGVVLQPNHPGPAYTPARKDTEAQSGSGSRGKERGNSEQKQKREGGAGAGAGAGAGGSGSAAAVNTRVLPPGVQENRAIMSHALKALKENDTAKVFWHPVSDKIAPGYSAVIPRPMDLGEIGHRITEGGYDVYPQLFCADVLLMCCNALVYNPIGHGIPGLALVLAKQMLTFMEVSLREWNAANERVAATRVRDDVYLQRCRSIISQLRAVDQHRHFWVPINTVMFPHYRNAVKFPMDLQTLALGLDNGKYPVIGMLLLDLLLIPVNCCLYHTAGTPAHAAAIELIRAAYSQFPREENPNRSERGGAGRGRGRASGRPKARPKKRRNDSDSDEPDEEDDEDEDFDGGSSRRRRSGRASAKRRKCGHESGQESQGSCFSGSEA